MLVRAIVRIYGSVWYGEPVAVGLLFCCTDVLKCCVFAMLHRDDSVLNPACLLCVGSNNVVAWVWTGQIVVQDFAWLEL
jgi:hypothetical protein